MLNPRDMILDLPKRDYWKVNEIAELFGVTKRTIQYACKRKSIGVKVKHGAKGIYLIRPEDLASLCKHIHGVVGNPNRRKIEVQDEVGD